MIVGLTMRNNPDDAKLPHKTMKETWGFLQRLQSHPTDVIDQIRPVADAADDRARVAIVDEKMRHGAILFELDDAGTCHFVYAGTYSNPDVYDRAARLSFKVNPINGVVSLIQVDGDRPTPAETTSSAPTPPAPPEPGPSATSASPATKDAVVQSIVESTGAPVAETPTARDAIAEQARPEKTPGQVPATGEKARPEGVGGPSQGNGAARSLLDGHDVDVVETYLGIDRGAYFAVAALTTEEGLDEALRYSPAWERDALLGLVAGMSIEDVLKELSFGSAPAAKPQTKEPAATVEPAASDTEIVKGMQHPAAEAEFTYIGDEAALKQVIEGGNFNAWRVFLHPSQRDIADKHFNGSARVTGGAGTGKTVVVVHRAHRLATLGKADARVLLTTFTRGLADSLKSQLNVLDPHYPEAGEPGDAGIWTTGADALAFNIIIGADKAERAAAIQKVTGQVISDPNRMGGPRALDTKSQNQMFRAALSIVENPPTGESATVEFLADEYIGVILAQGITTMTDYRKAARPGRGVALGRSDRGKVWAVIDQFHRLCLEESKFAWPAQAAIAAEILNARTAAGQPHLVDHVLVDEAQDFHSGHWRLLRAVVAQGADDIFLAEDSHQRIYGQRLVLSRFGIATRGRSRRLTVNYRTTRENLGYASAMLDGVEWIDSEGLDDELTGYRSMRSGPKPMVKQCDNTAGEEAAIADAIKGWLAADGNANIGVLTRTRAAVHRMVNALTEAGIDAVETRNATKAAESKVSVMTMHGAKGLEFTHVVLAGVDANAMPAQYRLASLSDHDRADALQMERALLYVAASRARDQLMITYSGDKSQFLPEMEVN